MLLTSLHPASSIIDLSLTLKRAQMGRKKHCAGAMRFIPLQIVALFGLVNGAVSGHLVHRLVMYRIRVNVHLTCIL